MLKNELKKEAVIEFIKILFPLSSESPFSLTNSIQGDCQVRYLQNFYQFFALSLF